MSVVHLYAGGVLVDLYENESISLSYQYTNFSEFRALGDFTQSFRVPATQSNATLFGNLDNANVSPTENYLHQKLDAELRVDTIPISIGYIRFIRSIIRLGIVADYEITFYSQMPDITKALGEKKLSDIAAVIATTPVVTYPEINDPADPTQLKWALIDRAQKFSEAGEVGVRRVNDPDFPLYAADMTPIVNWGWLLREMFNDAGFELDATALLAIIDAYWMPFCNSRYLQYTEQPSQFFFNAGFATNQTSQSAGVVDNLTEFYDNNGNFNPTTGTWTAPFTGYFTFRMWMTINPSGTTLVNFSPRLYNNSIGNFQPGGLFAAILNGTQVATSNFYNFQFQTQPLFITEGTELQMYLANLPTFDLQGSATNDQATGTGWGLVDMSQSMFGQSLDLAANAPDMKQIDFLRDIINAHCCAVIPDRAVPNKIKLIPQDQYIGGGSNHDWTQKLDIEKDIILESTIDYHKKQHRFTYKAGDDVWSKLFVENGRVYGEYKIDGYTVSQSATPSDFASGELLVQLTTRSTPANYINGTGIVVPKFMNAGGEFIAPGPRMLYATGSADVQMFDDDSVATVTEPVNLVNHYADGVDTDVGSYDLNFASETPGHEIIATPYYNLFNVYWRNYLNGIYSPEARMMECYMDLNVTDIINFSYADKYWIRDAWWRIIRIDGYKVGLSESTKVTFAKIVTSPPGCLASPDSSSGLVVAFVDVNDDPTPATLICCKKYGFFWDDVNEKCFSVPQPHTTTLPSWMGNSIGGTGQPTYSLAIGAALNIDPAAIYSLIAGLDIQVGKDNAHTLAVGDHIQIADNQRGAAVLGKNIYTNMPGLHLGGGWFGDSRDEPDGCVQSGVIMFAVKGGYADATTSLELLCEGIAGKRINLPVKTGWSCVLTLNLMKVAGGVITESAIAQFAFTLQKETVMGVPTATVDTVYDVFKETTFISPVLTVDVATDVDEHRLKITTTGAGYPHNDCWTSAKLEYIQLTHA